MRELMKFRGQEGQATTSIPSSGISSAASDRRVGSGSGSSGSGVSTSNKRPYRPSRPIISSTEAGVRTNEMNVSPGTLGIGGKTTKVEVLSDGLKWLVIYSLLPFSSAGVAMSGMGGSGLEMVSRTVDASSTLGSLGKNTVPVL